MEAELPFPRQVVVVLMRVSDLISALERMISRAIPNGSGAYPHISSNGKLKYKIVETETSFPSTPSGSSTSSPVSSGSSTPASSSATSSPITPSVSVSSAIHHKEAKIVSFEVDGNQKGKEDWLYVVITEFMEMGGDEIPEWRLSSRIPAPAEAKDRTSEMRTLECVLGYLRSSSISTSTNTRTYTPVEEGRVLKEE
jgi:hypothetical protein